MVDLKSDENCHVSPNIDNTRTNYLDVGSLQLHNFAWIISGLCTVLACILSFYLIFRHLQNYTKPQLQKHTIRIILMVPIYAIDSFLSFRFYWLSVYFDVVRDCYEAFVIYTFYSLLLEYLGGYDHGKELISKKGEIKLALPLCCIVVNPKRGLLRQCKRLTLQYVIIRPAMTIVTIILHSVNNYCPGNLGYAHGYIYVTFVNFVSVTVAMYALVQFYSISKDFIKEYRPIPKFLSVKFVIFLSFWQSILVTGFVAIHGLRATTHWTTDNISTGVQNSLMCVEMLLAAIAHIYAYPWREFETGTKTNVFSSAANSFNPHDIALDIFHSFFPHSLRGSNSNELILTPLPKQLLEDESTTLENETDEEARTVEIRE